MADIPYFTFEKNDLLPSELYLDRVFQEYCCEPYIFTLTDKEKNKLYFCYSVNLSELKEEHDWIIYKVDKDILYEYNKKSGSSLSKLINLCNMIIKLKKYDISYMILIKNRNYRIAKYSITKNNNYEACIPGQILV